MSRVRERERERERCVLHCIASAAAAVAATKMVRLSKFTRSVAFAFELQRRYRLAVDRIVLRTSSCIRLCRTASELKRPLMLCVCGKDRLYHGVAHTTTNSYSI